MSVRAFEKRRSVRRRRLSLSCC
uniref:Uncharacterized protein n=1 Tax=Arundo donax TaxID=35708 RepID=A0A0A9EGC8_ARUDO